MVMHDEELEVHLEETRVVSGGPYAGLALAACKIAESSGATVLAVRRNESFVTNPPDHFVLAADDVLIVLGTKGQLAELNSKAGARGSGRGGGAGRRAGQASGPGTLWRGPSDPVACAALSGMV